jgi:hypothetical protein
MKARAAGGVSPGRHTRTMRLSMVGWVTETATMGRREFLLLDPDGNRLAFFAK